MTAARRRSKALVNLYFAGGKRALLAAVQPDQQVRLVGNPVTTPWYTAFPSEKWIARPVRKERRLYSSMNPPVSKSPYSSKKRSITAAASLLRISTGHGPLNSAPAVIPDLLREAARRLRDVDADAEHGPVEAAAFKVDCGLGQNAADLPAVQINVVHPLDLRMQRRHVLDRPAHGDRGRRRDEQRALGRAGRAQQEAEIDARAGRRLDCRPRRPLPAV